ncbi:MAG TPA: hypothetical protein VMT87_03195 [Vicinamibacteria bacterium]|nr:hypothetical protein [Vicinamibacteria bacterium]
MTRPGRLLPALLALASSLPARAASLKFLPDDPVAVDDDRLPMPRPARVEVSTTLDVIERTFKGRPDGNVPRAVNVNTLGEVPDSSWFTNRMGARTLSIEELVRGPLRGDGPDLSRPWTVIRGKSGGISPGFTVRDARGDVYFVKPDPEGFPNLSTAADVIGSRFFHAFGYFVPENHVAYVRRDQLAVAPDARITESGRGRRTMTEADLDRILARVYRRPDGAIRVVAGRALPGEDIGPHEFIGTRPDDANDVFPHEHRRDLRGYRVFAAWLNHDDSRAVNTLDTFMPVAEGRGWVRHHLIDFASALGSGSSPSREIAPQGTRPGHEYVVEISPALKTAVTFGLWERPWRKVKYDVHAEIGRIEAAFFRPQAWKPEYPNPAFERMLPDDAFWAARIVSRFTDEMVRALVHTGQYDDPAAERRLAETLIERRDKTVAHYFRQVNPLAEFEVAGDVGGGRLCFRNLGEEAGLGPAGGYEYQWFAFDNATHALRPLGAAATTTARELAVPAAEGDFRMVRIRTRADEPGWAKAVDVYLRGGKLVGIEREN